MLTQTRFYFATQRKLIVSFGALFDNIYISRFSIPGGQGTVLKSIKVPVSYGPAQKWIKMAAEGRRDPTKTKLKNILPRISYEMLSPIYDPTRKLPTMGNYVSINPDNTMKLLSQLNPVPYDFDFNLFIVTKNLDDGFQIQEQILPNFTPSFNLRLKEIPELQLIHDIPVIFKGMTHEDSYEGQFTEDRVITWTLAFKVKAYLFPVITDQNIIKMVIATLYPDEEMQDPSSAVITVQVDPISANEDDVDSAGDPAYTIETDITESE